MHELFDLGELLEPLIDRAGGFARAPGDGSAATCFGITEAVARAHGYAGAMRNLPRDEASRIYTGLYWLRPRLDEVSSRSPAIAAILFETAVNMGPGVAVTFLQRALTALNRAGGDYPDLVPDGRIGERTLAALDAFLAHRGPRSGQVVLIQAIGALQGERYLRLAERRPAREGFLYEWLANRIGEDE